MGSYHSTTNKSVDGTNDLSSFNVLGDSRKYTVKSLTGQTTTTVTRREQMWVGSEIYTPLHIGPYLTTPIAIPTLEKQIEGVNSTQEIIHILRTAPKWMEFDILPVTKKYFLAHIPTRHELDTLKSCINRIQYNEVAASILENIIA